MRSSWYNLSELATSAELTLAIIATVQVPKVTLRSRATVLSTLSDFLGFAASLIERGLPTYFIFVSEMNFVS